MSMSDLQDTPPSTGPYAAAAATYWAAGWRGILPLPTGQKAPVPNGWTGARGDWPSRADIQAWTEDRPAANLALRLPPGVIGIDVDHYGDKPGGVVFHQLEQDLGALPATWRTTSRDDGVSGIRLYRIPEGLRWPGGLGPGIDTIRVDHRYAVAWPSVHPNGGTYRWITPDGATSLGLVPTIEDLPALPDAWIEHFTRGELAADQPHADLTDGAAGQWLLERGHGQPCRHMASAATRAQADLTTATSRHDATLSATNRIVWLAGEGHTGATIALQQLRAAFLAATAGDRAAGDAEGEWDRMVAGAVRIAAAAHPTPSPDPCLDPFAGLIPKEQPWTAPTPAPTTRTAAPSSTTSTASPQPSNASQTPSPTPSSTSASTDTALSSETTPAPEPVELDRTTWWPRDLEGAITGESSEPDPAHLIRDDGQALFYRGRVNGIIGPSESGKTWIALEAVAQAARAGERVTILDFEDSDTGVIGRLSLLGLTAKQLREHVAYINPDEPFVAYLPTGRDLNEHLEQWRPDLLIVDGFNAAMTLQGLDLMSNKDATQFAQTILKPIAARDVCVVYIDHVPKSKDNTAAGGIGAQAKRAMTTGCTLRVDPVKPFGKGQDGRLRVYVDKDRPGHVRGASAPSNGTHWAADVILASGPDSIRITIAKPEGLDTATHRYEFRPTVYMERVSAWLEDNPGAGRNEIVAGVSGTEKFIKDALKVLIDEGWVGVTKQGQKHFHTVVTPFTEVSDLVSPPPSGNWGRTGGEPGAAPPVEELGAVGATGGTTYPVPTPSSLPSHTTENTNRGRPPVERVIERVIAGERVKVNLDTGEMEPA